MRISHPPILLDGSDSSHCCCCCCCCFFFFFFLVDIAASRIEIKQLNSSSYCKIILYFEFVEYLSESFFLLSRGGFCRRRWLSGTILASLVLDSTRFWVRISARTPILRNITTGGDITGGFFPGAGFPSCHKSIYRVGGDNFRGSACVSERMLISV
jgi:hypothetical protein